MNIMAEIFEISSFKTYKWVRYVWPIHRWLYGICSWWVNWASECL